MMIYHECPYCGVKLVIDTKEIIPLTDEDNKLILAREQKIKSLANEKIKTLFGYKKSYDDDLIKLALEVNNTVYGSVKCICGKTSFLFCEKV